MPGINDAGSFLSLSRAYVADSSLPAHHSDLGFAEVSSGSGGALAWERSSSSMAWQQPPPMRPMQQQPPYPNFPQAGPASSATASNPFYNPELLRTGIGAYTFLGNGKDYVQDNLNRLLAGQDPHYYFQLNEQYVVNKLKVILCPFLHRGHWARIAEPTPNGISYQPPRYDINAPDLYIPLMAFATYLVLRCFAFGTMGKFTPAVMNSSASCALGTWVLELGLLKLVMALSGDAPWLDLVAYSGYSLVGLSLSMLARVLPGYIYYGILLWTSICFGVFLVKTLKRVMLADVRRHDRDSAKHHYLLLFVAFVQVLIFFWFSSL